MQKRKNRPRIHATMSLCIGSCLALLLTLITLLFPMHANALARTANDGPTFRVSAGFDSRYRDGNWIPIQISLSNNGADFTGSVSVNVPAPYAGTGNNQVNSVYQAPVSLANGAQKQVMLYVPFYFGSQGTTQSLTVDLLDSNGQRVSSQPVVLRTLNVSDIFVGVLSDQSAGFGPISNITLPNSTASVIVEPLNTSNMPTVASVLKNFDLIVLDNFTTSSLSKDQMVALQNWVNQGGALIMVGGPEWRHTLSPLPADLLPVTITGTQDLPADSTLLPVGGPSKGGLSHSTVVDKIHAPVTVSNAIPAAGSSVILAAGKTPLIVQSQQEQGLVCYLAFDPTLDPIVNWSGATTLWKGLLLRTLGDQLLAPGPNSNFGNVNRWQPYSIGTMDSVVQSLLPNTFPSIWLILTLLLGYILVLGPIRFLIVRRVKKRDWSWRIVVSTIVIFTLLSYGIALQQKGTAVISSTVSIIQLGQSQAGSENTSEHLTTYLGVFVPSQGDFHIHIANSGLVQPSANPFGYGGQSESQPSTITPQPDGTNVDLKSVNIWTLHTIVSEQDSQTHGGIVSHLTLQNGTLVGTVTNTLPYALSDVYVLMAYRYMPIGHLGSGQTLPINLPLNIAQGDPGVSIADQIASSHGISPQSYGPYSNNQQAQSEIQRHVMILSLLSGENNSYYCNNGGPCAQPAIYTKNIAANGVVVSGGGSYQPNSRDPLLVAGAPATLIGWADTSPSIDNNITINGTSATGAHEALVQAPLSVGFSGNVNLPSSFVGSQLVDVQSQGNAVQGQLPGVYTMTTGSMTFEFTLPSISKLHVSSATITETANLSQVLQSMGSQSGMVDVNHTNASLYNWKTGKWDAVPISSFSIQIKSTDPYIGSGGRVLLQFANQDATQGTIVLNRPTLQLQGTV